VGRWVRSPAERGQYPPFLGPFSRIVHFVSILAVSVSLCQVGSTPELRAQQLSELSLLINFCSDGNDPILLFADNVREDPNALRDLVVEVRFCGMNWDDAGYEA
jgi:hypothetical protein